MWAISLFQPWASLLVTRQPCETCNGAGGGYVRTGGDDNWDSEACEPCSGTGDGRMVKRIVSRSWPCPEKYWGQRMAFASTKREPDVGQQLGPYFVSRADNQSRSPVLAGPGHDLDLPLGCILGTGIVTACVQIMEVRDDGTWTVMRQNDSTTIPGVVLDQLPYSDFTPGRWAWLIEDPAPTIERCPWCWDMEPIPDPIPILDVDGDPWPGCRFCRNDGHCEPIPIAGHQRIWQWTP